jgi:hypothetical protein
MPGQHPDDDLLADLAADVLPLDQARAVEGHVLGCDRCASLLSDAERVRGLLLADDAGPVPPEIWNRIEAALQAPSPASHTGRDERAPAPPPPPAAPLTRRVDAGGPGGWDGPDPLDNPDDWATAIRPAVTSDSRPGPTPGAGVRGTSTSRRDSRPERRLRPAPLLLSAAAAVVLLLAVGAVRLVQSGGGPTAAFGNSASSDAGGGASAAAPSGAGTVITRSGRDYTSSTLAAAAASLVHPSAQAKGQSAGGAVTRSLSSSPEPRAAAAPEVAPDPKATDVTNPQRLAACLSALGAASDSVVAVDLARYQGREAAVLVVRTANGYEVWVVERTCHPGDEGALAERTLPG